MSSESKYDQTGAFGNPDGSRENFARYIHLEPEGLSQVNPTYVDHTISHRVIVGAKGSGKTLYLRKMEVDALENDSIIVIRHSNQLPSTDSILSIHKLYDDTIRTEQWSLIWRRAIFLSLASQFYCQIQINEKIKITTETNVDEFYKTFKHLIPKKFPTPQSIFSQISSLIITHGQSYKRLSSHLEDPEWDSLEYIITAHIKHSPPLVYFIDAIDEELRHAPAAWLDFQKGLFYQVMRMLRDNELGNRLHIIICIRDLVYSSVLQSEHAGRYIKDEHIKILHWSRRSAREFLTKKIEALNSDYFIDKNKEKTITNLVGAKEIRNKKRGITEDIEDYILRHTRYFPRDIINIGNSICQEIKSQMGNRTPLSEEVISKSISSVASIIARETLAVCGNNLAVSSLPSRAIKQEILENFSENPIVADVMKEIIYAFIKKIGRDEFDYDALKQAIDEFQYPLDKLAEKNKFEQYRLDTVLWQHGLIGYKNRKRDKLARFNNSSPTEPFTLPTDKPFYVLHSCLHDEIASLKYKKGTPIVCE